MAQNYFDSIVQIDDSTDASSHILFAMATCLSDEEIQKNKIDELIKDKKITKTAITSGIDYFRKEIVRRVALINKEEERDGVASNKRTKLPRSKNWTKTKLTKWLCDHFLLGSEKAWVVGRIDSFVNLVEEDAERKENEKKETGGNISRATKLKMRLYEACFLDEFRDDLIRMYDSKNRGELDARNSERRPMTFFEVVVEKYNSKEWNPDSTVFDEFHHEFGISFPLPLYRNDGQEEKREPKLTIEKAKEIFRDSKASMNWSVAAWKKSGNGKGNLAEGEKLRVKGTSYYCVDEDEAVIKYIDDDRFDFCGNSLPTGYFWCIAEMHDLVGTVSQSCEEVGVTMDNIRPTIGADKTPRSSKEKDKKIGSHIFLDEMKEMMRKNEKNMSEYRINKLRSDLNKLRSDLQSVSDYKATADNDYASAFKEYITYKGENGDDADAEYLSILDEMKVSKKVRLTELENENARLRDEICDVELAQKAVRKEATEDSDSSSSVPKRKKRRKLSSSRK